jgi:hypothetical protein
MGVHKSGSQPNFHFRSDLELSEFDELQLPLLLACLFVMIAVDWGVGLLIQSRISKPTPLHVNAVVFDVGVVCRCCAAMLCSDRDNTSLGHTQLTHRPRSWTCKGRGRGEAPG